MADDEAVLNRVLRVSRALNRILGATAGLAVLVLTAIILLSDSNLLFHPANNPLYGAFLAAINLIGIYWLVTAVFPDFTLSQLLAARSDVEQQDVIVAGLLALVLGVWILMLVQGSGPWLMLLMLLAGSPVLVMAYLRFQETDDSG